MGPITLDRATFACTGADAHDLLERLVTCAVRPEPTYGALLTPQGKVMFDFILTAMPDGYRFDCAANQRDDLMKRLGFYKLRADVTLTPLDETVTVGWGDTLRPDDAFTDPRLPALGWRSYADDGQKDERAWMQHRIGLGIPELGADAEPGTAFPHDLSMDQFATGSGVAFDKGCYVGQEVVSRMQHRGTARSRFVRVSSDVELPANGTPITTDERTIGTLGSVCGNQGLALVRLDRWQAADAPVVCGSATLDARIPEFASYDWPS